MSDYAQGFKDGFAAGLEEGKKLAPVKSVDPWGFGLLVGSPGCPVCGRFDGGSVMGYVCYNPKCPTRITAYTTGGAVTGAVGSSDNMSYSVGANGPTMNDTY